ncbi:hypothetical protein D3C84_1142480 [compost metagenome]
MAARNFVKLLPIDRDAIAFFNICQGFGVLYNFPRMSGYAVLFELKLPRTTNNAFKIV